MVTENDEMPTGIGWPLGLGFLNMRLRVVEYRPYSLHVPSTSFSSFSSSNLDTESTASFFQDNSRSLANLIGIRQSEEREKKSSKGCSDASKEQQVDMSRGICIPMLLHTLKRITIGKSKKRVQATST